MTRIRLAVCAAVCAVAAAGLAGCGSGGDDAGPQSSQPAASDLPTELPSGTPSAGGTISPKPAKLPAGFPLPDGAKKGDFTETNGNVAGTVTVTDGAKAFDFWVDELPKDDYSVTSKNKAEFAGTKALITFSGKGYSSATITISDKTATISLQQ